MPPATAERLQRATRLSWDLVVLVDRRAHIEYVNQAIERLLGYTEDELVGRDGLALVHPDDLDRARDIHVQLIAQPDRPLVIELRLRHRAGTWRWMEFVGRNLLADPVVRAIVVNARDVTDLRAQRQALESAHREALVFRQMVELASQAIGTADLQTRVLYQNPSLLKLLGLPSLEAARRHTYEDFYRPEDLRQLREEVIAEVLARGHWTGEMLLQPQGREALSTIQSIYLLRDAAGEPYALSNVVTDITEQKRVEQNLRASEAKYRQLFEQSLDGIALADVRSGQIVDCNEAFCRLSGWTRAELVGRSLEGLHHRLPDAPASRLPCVDREELTRNEQLVTAAGELRDVEIKCQALELDGVAVRQSIYRDVTLRKQAEAALQRRILALTRPLGASPEEVAFEDLFNLEDIQRLQDLFSGAFGVASLITTPDGTPITEPSNFTEFCATVVRSSPTGMERCRHSDIVVGRHNPTGPNIQPCLSAGLCQAGASITVGGHHVANWLIGQVRSELQDEETIVRFADEIGGDAAAFRAAYRKLPSMPLAQFERVAHVLFVFARQLSDSAYQNVQQARFIAERDQAEAKRKELEMALRQRQHELERFARLDLLNNIASGLAHELNQPIAAAQYLLSGCLRIVRNTSLSQKDMGQILSDVYSQVERVGKIVEQISGLSRQHRTRASTLKLGPVLRECLALMDFEFRRDAIATSLEAPPDLPAIRADRIRIQQCVLIALQNAIESIRSRHGSGGHIEIGAAGRGQTVEVWVRDDGPGFSKDALQNLFLPFFTTKEGGMGLGLPICRAIVDEYGGQVIVHNNAERGATVKFVLPLR